MPENVPPEVNRVLQLGTEPESYYQEFLRMEPGAIARVLAFLRSTGLTGETFSAIRDAGRLIAEEKLSARLIRAMEKLDRSAGRLAVVGIVLTVVIGIAQIIVPLLVGAK